MLLQIHGGKSTISPSSDGCQGNFKHVKFRQNYSVAQEQCSLFLGAVKPLHHSISPLSWLYRDSANGGDFMGGEDPRWGGWMIIGWLLLIIYIITQFALVF